MARLITRGFINQVARDMKRRGESIRSVRSLIGTSERSISGITNAHEISQEFSDVILPLVIQHWTSETGQQTLPKEQYDLIKRSYVEELLSSSNLAVFSSNDWNSVAIKALDAYEEVTDRRLTSIIREAGLQKIKDSKIYWDIINSIASKATGGLKGRRFDEIKYTYAVSKDSTVGKSGDLIDETFTNLLTIDDIEALSKLVDVYSEDQGITSDPLYLDIKDRVASRGLEQVKSIVENIDSGESISSMFGEW